MKTTTKLHLQTVSELLELISLGGLLALIADVIWVVCDIIACDFSRPELYVVAIILTLGLVLTATAVYKYHMKNFKNLVKEKLQLKLSIIRYKRHHFHKEG